MLNSHRKLIPLSISFSIAITLGLQSHSAMSLPYQLSLSGKTSVEANGYEFSQNGVMISDTLKLRSSAKDTNFYDSYSNAEAGGDNQGRLYVGSRGRGPNFKSESTVIQTYDITNNTGFDQILDFNFIVNSGWIDIYTDTWFSEDEYAVAGYTADILVNGNSVWNSAANFSLDKTVNTLTQTGVILSTHSPGQPYKNALRWDEQDFDIALGRLNAGKSLNIQYVINTYVEGSLDDPGCTWLEDGTADEDEDLYECYFSLAYADFRDPSTVITDPFTARAVNPNPSPVSEPASIALLGLGLTGLAFARRRKSAYLFAPYKKGPL